jgi:hypothetical protein
MLAERGLLGRAGGSRSATDEPSMSFELLLFAANIRSAPAEAPHIGAVSSE